MRPAIVTCTIVLPSHNRPALLQRAVSSALRACPADGEVLVVDDGSDVPAKRTLAHIEDTRLRVHRTERAGGAATARNEGVRRAQGEVIFFLDDDDEMLVDYCQRVLSKGAQASVWGFCSAFERHGEDSAQHRHRQRRRLQSGLVARQRPLRDHIAALSEGFWIRRQLFLDVGGFRSEQVVDEDTDLCCQLYRLGHCAWYESEPGVVIYKGYSVADSHAAQLTRATPHDVLLAAYRRTFERHEAGLPPHSEARWFLCARYLRRAARSGRIDEAQAFLKCLEPTSLRGLATLYWWIKRCQLSGRKS
jgi:GT2 family glycosyltransferase